MKKITKLWGSRFDTPPDKAAIAFAAGRDVSGTNPCDTYLLPYDIWLNKAHCLMLYKQTIISKADTRTILKGLQKIEELASINNFPLDPKKEDVHTNIESWLIEKYGIDFVGKLHTARSRNDQVVTDTRLYLRQEILHLIGHITLLVDSLVKKSGEHIETVMPGFTHHQHAMVTTFGHVLIAFVSMFIRDIKKLQATYAIINTNPLGSAASFGTSFKIDRHLTTKFLGFNEPDLNSLDAITNRGEPESDIAYCLASMMNHLSTLAQTLIIFSTPEFSFVKVSDKYSTGSSIMPQKKNPDTLEVVKGKAALAQGALQSLLASGKGAFIGYNRDSQWTKYIIMDTIEDCAPAPLVISGLIDELVVNKEAMEQWSHKAFIGATSFLELLCQNYDIPFRKGKIIVEKAIRYSKDTDKIDFEGLQQSLKEEEIDISIDEKTLQKWQDPYEIINLYASLGSPSISFMQQSLLIVQKRISENKNWLAQSKKSLDKAATSLEEEIKMVLSAV